MSEPMTDMSLVPPLGWTTIYPLELVPLELSAVEWSRQIRQRLRGVSELWTPRRKLRLVLPGLPLQDCRGPAWRAYTARGPMPAVIEVYLGHVWDGASGPAVDDAEALLASLVHDIVVQALDGVRVYAIAGRSRGRVCPSWRRRAWVYGAILRAQGESRTRCVYSVAAVAAYDLVTMIGRLGR